MATTSDGGARVTFTLFCPVLFATSDRVWWAMVDSGAQVSLISSGLMAYLGLLDEQTTQAYPSSFSVVGFDGERKMQLPILEVWIRMGTQGDQLRWERIHFTVLHSI